MAPASRRSRALLGMEWAFRACVGFEHPRYTSQSTGGRPSRRADGSSVLANCRQFRPGHSLPSALRRETAPAGRPDGVLAGTVARGTPTGLPVGPCSRSASKKGVAVKMYDTAVIGGGL